MAAGIDDVARAAGVSTATVSRALRGLPNVTPATRAKVREVATALGYVASPSAASLASGRTRTIGLISPWINRWFFANVIEGAERALRAQGFDVLLYTFDIQRHRGRPRVDPDVLRRELKKASERGIAVSVGEWIEDAAGVAAPIFDQHGQVIAALSISGPTQRFTKENVRRYGEEVKSAAARISESLGYSSTNPNQPAKYQQSIQEQGK